MRSFKKTLVILAAVALLATSAVPAGAVTPGRLLSVSFADADHGVVAGGGRGGQPGFAMVSSTGGVSWAGSFSDPNLWVRGASLAPGGVGVLATDGKTPYRTTDHGLTWTPSTPIGAAGAFKWFGVAMGDSLRGYLVGTHLGDGEPATVYGTADGGRTWASRFEGPFYEAPSPDEDPPSTVASLRAVDVARGTTSAWAVGYQSLPSALSLVVHSVDGTTWAQQSIAGNRELHDVAAVDANRAVVIARGAYLSTTTDGGATWSAGVRGPGLFTGATWYAIDFVDATTGWIACDGGRIYKTTNGGAAWTQQTTGVTANLRDITFVDASNGWAVGDDETILRTTNGGATWTRVAGMGTATLSLGTNVSTVNYMAGAVLRGAISGARPATVTLEEYRAGTTGWTAVKPVSVAADGTYWAYVRPYVKTSYRVSFGGSPTFYSATSPAVAITPRVYLTTPTAPTIAYRGRTFTSAGYIKPRHTAGQYCATVFAYRYEGGRWVKRGTFSARASNVSSYTRYTAAVKLPYAGKWRLRAYHSDSVHAATWSGYRYLTVR